MPAQPVIQASFNTGEWAPTLNARVDMTKYHSAAKLLENFFVDYRGGASSRAGTKYILQAYKSATAVRLIPFQASFTVGYVCEFGDFYIRFYNNGAPVLEAAKSITGAAAGPPEVFTSNAHGYSNNDWLKIAGKYYIVKNAATNTFTLTDLFGTAINTNPFTLPTNAQRVYTIVSPYAAADLALVKFAQNVNQLYLCHPSYPPQNLTYNSATNWTIQTITFGSTVNTPTGGTTTTTLAGGSVNYGYLITAVDFNGQESAPTTPILPTNLTDLRTIQGTITITWNSVAGAASYNVYKAEPSYTAVVQPGVPYGFIGNATGLALNDSNITPDFSQTPPYPSVPFGTGAAVSFATILTQGTYTGPGPAITATFATSPTGVTATGTVIYAGKSVIPAAADASRSYTAGDILTFPAGIPGLSVQVLTVDGAGTILTAAILTAGSQVGGTCPTTNLAAVGGTGHSAVMRVSFGITGIQITNPGSNYLVTPTIVISATGNAGEPAATAVATLGPSGTSYPSVPTLFQQRLVLAAPTVDPQTLFFSQPGSYFNFDTSQITQATDAIKASLVSGQLNTIKSMISQPAGLLVLSDKASWLINGGTGLGSAISPSALVANAQSFNGASDVPPIVSNYDVLYVQAKGSVVRDSSYNFYANVFTGTDISVLSSHLFYGYSILEWAWAEEPFKIVWAVRDDGVALSLTFLKEQEFIGWTHSVTQGNFKSVSTIIEGTADQTVDAVYWVVERVVQGQTLKYIERMAERIFPNGVVDAWCVDAGLQYNGAPATTFSGGEHLAGLTCTGLADGVIIPSFVMPASGTFTLGSAASKVTVGLPYTCDAQTLAIDLGEPTVQGKVKKIPDVDVRVSETLGLSIGSSFATVVPMKDLIRGNVSSMLTGLSSQIVTDLVTGDARTILDPTYNVPGQYCIRQSNPYPASILGVIPRVVIGDTK